MSLFKTTADLKVFCPSINKNMAWATISPVVDQAEKKYILKLIGSEQFSALDTAYNADTLTTEQEELLSYVQRPLAYYTYYELIPQMQSMVSDLGVSEHTSSEGTANPVRQWVYDEMRDNAIQNGDIYADQLLVFLEVNYTDYPLWKDSSVFTLSKELFINSTAEFEKYISLNSSKRIWLALRPFLKQCEVEYILPAITEPLYNDLKEKISDSLAAPLSDSYSILLIKIQQALSWLTIYKALPFSVIQFSTAGIVMNSTFNTKSLKSTPDRIPVETARTEAYTNGLSALRALKQYLEENSSSYDKYSDPNAYSQPNYEIPDNRGKKSFMV